MGKKQIPLKFGIFGILALVLAVISVFVPGAKGISVAFGAVIAGFLGGRRKERFSLLGMILAAIVLIFLNFQSMGIIPSHTRNADLMRHYTNAIRASAKVLKAIKKEAVANSPESKGKARKKIINAIDESLEAARKLEATRFDPYIPGFSQHFRDEFIAGMTYLKIGYTQANKADRAKGAVLLDNWALWVKNNRNILIKLWRQWHPQPSLYEVIAKRQPSL